MIHIHDEQNIICVDGLRWAVKADREWSGARTRYEIEIAYKGQTRTLIYDNSKDRDAFFAAIAAHLKKASTQP